MQSAPGGPAEEEAGMPPSDRQSRPGGWQSKGCLLLAALLTAVGAVTIWLLDWLLGLFS